MMISNFPMWQHFFGNEEDRIERETEFIIPDSVSDLKSMIAEFRQGEKKGSGPPGHKKPSYPSS